MRSASARRGLGAVAAIAVGILIYLAIGAAAVVAVLRWPHAGLTG